MYSAAGGFVGSMYRGKGLGSNLTVGGTFQVSGSLIAGNNYATQGGQLGWQNGSIMAGGTSGIITLYNLGLTDFTRLQFGGTTSSFPSLARNSLRIWAQDATGTVSTPLAGSNFIATAVAGAVGAGEISIGGTTATTVGAAGAAAAIPTPVGYIIINVAGTQMKIPYCNT